jgi:hypothetical protein
MSVVIILGGGGGRTGSGGLEENLRRAWQNRKAYAIDKNYKQGGPMLSLGRFWSVLPWPLRDRPKGLDYFREYQLDN